MPITLLRISASMQHSLSVRFIKVTSPLARAKGMLPPGSIFVLAGVSDVPAHVAHECMVKFTTRRIAMKIEKS